MEPNIQVEVADVLEYASDVLVLKYAQARHGVDAVVAAALSAAGHRNAEMSPRPGDFRIVESGGAISAKSVMFAGVGPLYDFGYREIRLFARKALEDLAGRAPEAERIAFTTHGAGYGLDEREAFESLIAGFLDAMTNGDLPESLAEIVVVERNRGRARRLEGYLAGLPAYGTRTARSKSSDQAREAQSRLGEVGFASDAKPHVFVAMPFSEAKSDHYHYGIQGAVNAAGYLCERVDLTAFTGEVLDRIKRRISSAELVVADLSGANANVYLEVGYAWGKGIPTVLLSDDATNLKFDVQGQRCLMYRSIRDLEAKLTTELSQLRASQL